MADNTAQPTLADILLAEELGQPRPHRPWMPEVGAGGYGMPYFPPLPGRPPREVRSGLDPVVDTLMGLTGLPTGAGSTLDLLYALGAAGPRQVQKAEHAIGRAVDDPSLGNIANAGTQTGMAALRPAIALPSLAVQYGDALARDLEVFDTSAQAQQAKRTSAPPASKAALPGLTSEQQAMYDAAEKRIRDQSYSSGVERRQLEQTMQELRALSANIQLKGAESRQGVEADAARLERQEYDRAVRRAEDLRKFEEDKRKTFRDTAVGQVWEETGGAAPFLAGAASGVIQRGMNPNVSHKTVMGMGALGGAGASNVPLGADAYLVPPVENPDKRAAEAYARELPPNHPRKQEWLDYAASPRLPSTNPARTEAQQQLWDTWPALKRNLFGAAEGVFGSELGYGAVHIPGRAVNAVKRTLGGLADRLLPSGSRPPTAGGVIDDIPSGNVSVGMPTAAHRTVAPIPPASSSSPTGRPAGDQRIVGGGPPNLPAPAEPSLADVLMRLDPANSNRAHHSRYQPRGQKDNPGAFRKGKPEYPESER